MCWQIAHAIIATLCVGLSCGALFAAELPRVQVDVRIPTVSGRTLNVRAGGNLQAAIDEARPGDEIVLDAGAKFTGSFVLRNKQSGTGWVTIRSSGPLPDFGTRVTKDDARGMATLVSPGRNQPALNTEAGAHHYYVMGLEITAAPQVTSLQSLVNLGDASTQQDTVDEVPHHLVLDRVYVHGRDNLDLRRGISLNSAHTAIVHSNISEAHSRGSDSQAIAGWNGTGPYLIENNYLEGAGENLLFGGGTSYISGALPSDITIRENTFFKPVSWQGAWTVKNLLELKVGLRVLIENNSFANNWVDGQDGFAIVFKSTDQDGKSPWSQTADVTFRDNLVENSPAGVNIASRPEQNPALPARRFVIARNVFNEIGTFAGTSSGRMFQLVGSNGEPLVSVAIEHNIALHNLPLGATIMFDGEPTREFIFRNNIVTRGEYGIFGGGSSEGARTLLTYTPGGIFTGNVMIGAPAARFGSFAALNSFPRTLAESGVNDDARMQRLLRSRHRPLQ